MSVVDVLQYSAQVSFRVDIFLSLQEAVVIVMSNLLLGVGQLLISSFHITDSFLSIYSSVYAHGQANPMW